MLRVKFNKLGGYWETRLLNMEVGRSATEELAEQLYDRALWRWGGFGGSSRRPFNNDYYKKLTLEQVQSGPGGEFIEHYFKSLHQK